ncbi:sensor histidine kinase [Candidatus Nitrospira bockiana]
MTDVCEPQELWSVPVLPLLLMLSLALAVGIGFYALVTLRDVLVREKGTELARAAARVADILDRILFERAGDVRVFASDLALRTGSDEQRRQRLEFYKDVYGYYVWIALMGPDGRLLASTAASGDAPRVPEDVSQEAWFQEIHRTPRVHVHEPDRPGPGTIPTIGFSAPIRADGDGFQGAVSTRVSLAALPTVLEREGQLASHEGEPFDWLLMDSRGAVLLEIGHARPQAAPLPPQTVPLGFTVAQSDHNRVGYTEEMHLRRQVPVITGYAKLRGYGGFTGFDWTVLVRMDRDHAYAPINRLVVTVGVVGLLGAAPLALIGVWSSWKTVLEERRLRAVQRELQQTVTELHRSNSDLQQFAYVASHDLQEPLRMVSSYTQLVAKRYRGKLGPEADEFIGYAVDGAARMQKLIQDLLAFSRIDSQSHLPAKIAMDEVVNLALENLRRSVEESGAVVMRRRLPSVKGDQRQLVQLVQNLLSNAIKFRSARPPEIDVSAEPMNGMWKFAVRDNGIGLDPQFGDRIFVMFQRLHTRAQYPGTGIGLAICKKIVERHGGRIWVESQPGQGATFFFTLPGVPGDGVPGH